jgi:chromosome segregation ATPase
MYFALGFLVAGLLFLMFLPAFWRRAMRLSMRRLQMLAPMSMEEVVAERDLLRAEFALRERRLEQEMDAVKASKAQDLGDIGRHAARIADLDGNLKNAEARVRDLEADLRDSRKTIEERTGLLSSTEMALHELTERGENWVARLRDLQSDREELGRQNEMQQTRVVAHEAMIANMHQRGADMEREIEQLQGDLAVISKEAERLSTVEADLAWTSTLLMAIQEAKRSLEEALDETRAQLKSMETRHKSEVERLENALRLARAETRDHAGRLEAARSDNAMLTGTVEALRKEHAILRQGQGARQGAAAPVAWLGEALNERDVETLRLAITQMGARMTEMAEESEKFAHSKRAL